MIKVKVINGFTDIDTGKNYQDNEIIELSEDRFEKLNGSYVEPFSEPVIETSNDELKAEIEKLNKELEKKNNEIEKLKEKLSDKSKGSKDKDTKPVEGDSDDKIQE